MPANAHELAACLTCFTGRRLDVRKGADPALLDQQQNLQRQLNALGSALLRVPAGKQGDVQRAALQRQLDRDLEEFDRLEVKMRASAPRYAALMQSQPVNAEEIQRG